MAIRKMTDKDSTPFKIESELESAADRGVIAVGDLGFNQCLLMIPERRLSDMPGEVDAVAVSLSIKEMDMLVEALVMIAKIWQKEIDDENRR